MKKSDFTFDQFLQHNLTYYDYANLDTLMQESPHRVTKVKQDPTTGTLVHLLALLPLLKKIDKSIDGKMLYRQFDFGSKIITQAEKDLLGQKTVTA